MRALTVTTGATLLSLAGAAIWGSRRLAVWCGITGEVALVLLLLVTLGAAAHEQQELLRRRTAAAAAERAAAGEPVGDPVASDRRFPTAADTFPTAADAIHARALVPAPAARDELVRVED